MIDYHKREWTHSLFTLRGSMVREISGRVSACATWAVAVVAVHHLIRSMAIQPTIHMLVGVALGLLLVFRTNASYDRYWEGRRQWGSIINETRNLGRAARTFLSRDRALLEEMMLWTIAFSQAAMNSLRGSSGLGAIAQRLPAAEVEAVLRSGNLPLAIAVQISERLVRARDRGIISDYVTISLDQNVQLLIDYFGACERIHKTPLPFVYVVHLRRSLVLYCFTLPFALVDPYGWWAIPASLLVAYTYFGIEEIGVEIENPFGLDDNDLPLERFCETIERDLLELCDGLGPREAASANSPRPIPGAASQ
ncbi:bestrophin family protein [Singulisphaera sp. GP187]|uniref:bestrophin family protein n=1 Tax=Singulisphaera sp. GP187 TaxID=1882752 RepID=UPI00094095D4|nr:bestrophin family ion channel [Singulisphaera sp. GP187]